MTISALKEHCENIKNRIPTFRAWRVEAAYWDLIYLIALSEEIEASIADKDISEIAKTGDSREIDFVVLRHGQIATLLKALYIFGTIFINIMLSEVMDKPKMSLNNEFLKSKKHPLASLTMDKLLPAYCVVTYRNKVIAHHDKRRSSGYIFGLATGQHRLAPLPEQLSILQSSTAEILRLKSSYGGLIHELQTENNVFELLQILFHNIPIGEFGNINLDRGIIDRIAEEGGCKSMTSNEIMKALDTFIEAISSSI